MNQYDMILTMSQYIRQNPTSQLSKDIKQCKSQSEQIILMNKLNPVKNLKD